MYTNTQDNESRYQAIRDKYQDALQTHHNAITTARRKYNVARVVADMARQKMDDFNAIPRQRWTQEDKEEKQRLWAAWMEAKKKRDAAEANLHTTEIGAEGLAELDKAINLQIQQLR